MIIADVTDDISNVEADEDDKGSEDRLIDYNHKLAEDQSLLSADDEIWDLKSSERVIDLRECLNELRYKLNNGELKRYEGRLTDWGGGGRSRLLYDTVRAELAEEYHRGRHQMSWEKQHQEAQEVVGIVANRTRAKWQG